MLFLARVNRLMSNTTCSIGEDERTKTRRCAIWFLSFRCVLFASWRLSQQNYSLSFLSSLLSITKTNIFWHSSFTRRRLLSSSSSFFLFCLVRQAIEEEYTERKRNGPVLLLLLGRFYSDESAFVFFCVVICNLFIIRTFDQKENQLGWEPLWKRSSYLHLTNNEEFFLLLNELDVKLGSLHRIVLFHCWPCWFSVNEHISHRSELQRSSRRQDSFFLSGQVNCYKVSRGKRLLFCALTPREKQLLLLIVRRNR